MKILSLFLTCLLASGSAMAVDLDDQIALVRQMADTERRSMVAMNMNLNNEEEEAFWPLYGQYREARAANGDRMLALIKNYAEHHMDLSDEKATELLEESFKVDKELLKIKKKYTDKFGEVLPPTKVMRLMQLAFFNNFIGGINRHQQQLHV